MSSKIKILVPVKRVIDAALKPRINKTNTGVESKGIKYSMNPFDDIAVEEACKMKKNYKDMVESIHAVSIGPSKAKDVLRTALAKGVDTSTLVDVGEDEIEPLVVSKILQKFVEREGSNLVVLGKQAIDDDSNQVGQMLAGLLGWSQATNAAKVTIGSDGIVEVEREIDGGIEIVKAPLPMVISTDLRLNEPKFVTLPKMMKAKKKPLEVVSPSDLNVEIKNRLETVSLEEPAPRSAGVMVSNVDELIAKLKELKAL
jgi:electron transfer flavoprotein beta subunit